VKLKINYKIKNDKYNRDSSVVNKLIKKEISNIKLNLAQKSKCSFLILLEEFPSRFDLFIIGDFMGVFHQIGEFLVFLREIW